MAMERGAAAMGPRPGGPMPGGAKPSFSQALDVFRSRNYRYLWTSSLFSFTGMQMQQVARALLAWHLTKSFGAVGAISLSFGLPMLLFSLVGGSLADRFEKRNLSLISQMVTGLLALINALMLVTDTITFEWLFVLGLGGGTAMALGMPARTPLMAQAVGPDKVMSAMAMSNAAMNFTRLFGPALAGAMVAAWNLESVYFLQAGLYVLSCITLLFVPTGLGNAMAHGPARKGMFSEIGEGLKYVATDSRLRMLNGTMLIISFFAMPYVMLLAGFVKEELGKGDGAFGLLQSVSGVGALAGSLGIATLTAFDRKNTVQWLSGMIGGAGLIGLAFGSQAFGYSGALVAILILGLALTAYQTLNSTLIMDATKPEYYGRVMSINMLSFSAMPLMAFPLGRVADVVGVQQMFAVQGIIVVGALVLVAIVNPGHSFGRVPPRAYPVGMGMGPGMARPGMRPPVAVEEEAAAAPAGGR
ncbi:MAG: MFS transporter [Dehalococcoidia bacterium]|nr:MFS transporter [Dehalococcoidia bacterium]